MDNGVTGIPHPLQRIVEARHHNPFEVLGRHRLGDGTYTIHAFLPGARGAFVEFAGNRHPMNRIGNTEIFRWAGSKQPQNGRYRLLWEDDAGRLQRQWDPYSFPPQITDYDLHLFSEGNHRHAYRFLGSRAYSIDGISGVQFSVWAPAAERVSVVGDFNAWDGRRHAMRCRGASGVWELFIPDLEMGTLYKFEIRNRRSGQIILKTDPYGQRFELPPATAAVVTRSTYRWNDARWMETRGMQQSFDRPISIYEVHLGSWQRGDDGRYLDYRELAQRLSGHVTEMGFTHIELLPIAEHPFDGSWGYQTSGYFAPTRRFGRPDDFRRFVDTCHQHGIGVILDWVPAHFPRDAHALGRFDGSTLYEHPDPRRGEHKEWETLIFDYGRNEVRSFLISSAVYWLREFHIDGLRVDAVASLLYLDYSRDPGEWTPNASGGNENWDAAHFLQQLHRAVRNEFPDVLTFAEESTTWPNITRSVKSGGLGFDFKWNMGWMNDTLRYLEHDPIHRKHHHNLLTFGLLYAFTERFLLPLSHDEVVHLKRSLLIKMPGDVWRKFANLRLLYTYLFTYPGKKLLFMGSEFAQRREWNHDRPLDWGLCSDPRHAGVKKLVIDLNRLYRSRESLHALDCESQGFEWLDCDDAEHSIISYIRRGETETAVVLLNFTPVPRHGYRLGVPLSGSYRVIFNSDSRHYGGGDCGNGGVLHSESIPAMGRPDSLVVTVPPLSGVILVLE